MTHPLALALAQAEQAHTDAQNIYQGARDREKTLAQKQAATQNAMRALSAKRLDGTATAEDAAELAAMDSDMALLSEMLAEARSECRALEPVEELARLETARFNWKRHTDMERLSALSARAKELDALMVSLIYELREAGKAVGRAHLSECWRPSAELEHTIRYEYAPR